MNAPADQPQPPADGAMDKLNREADQAAPQEMPTQHDMASRSERTMENARELLVDNVVAYLVERRAGTAPDNGSQAVPTEVLADGPSGPPLVSLRELIDGIDRGLKGVAPTGASQATALGMLPVQGALDAAARLDDPNQPRNVSTLSVGELSDAAKRLDSKGLPTDPRILDGYLTWDRDRSPTHLDPSQPQQDSGTIFPSTWAHQVRELAPEVLDHAIDEGEAVLVRQYKNVVPPGGPAPVLTLDNCGGLAVQARDDQSLDLLARIRAGTVRLYGYSDTNDPSHQQFFSELPIRTQQELDTFRKVNGKGPSWLPKSVVIIDQLPETARVVTGLATSSGSANAEGIEAVVEYDPTATYRRYEQLPPGLDSSKLPPGLGRQ